MEQKSGFTSSLGFVFAAAGSAVGVGNIWRFPYLAAQDGGGLFILIYLILVLTVGFVLLTTDVAIGRKTGCSPWHAFDAIHPRWGFLGKLTFIVPAIIMTYYTVIGGWVLKYMTMYLSGGATAVAGDGYFTAFITSPISPIVYMLIFLAMTAFVVYAGVEKGVERFSSLVMPGLLVMIVAIAVYSLTLSYTTPEGVTRTGLQGLAVYLIPDFTGITFVRFLQILLDAMSQVFFSLSVSMGIMITFGRYVPKDVNLSSSIYRIELFDTGVAILAGMMVIPAVYVFYGMEGMTSGPGLMFVSLPKVFLGMGGIGAIIGFVFFVMIALAALTSSVSILETLVSTCMDLFSATRKRVCLVITVLSGGAAAVICMGYNVLYFELALPNGQTAQLLDVMDYISNSVMMPLISLMTCIFIGFVVGPKWIEEEMELEGHTFPGKNMYRFVVRFAAPILMAVLFVTSTGIM